MGLPVDVGYIRTLIAKTFWCDGTRGHNCGTERLEAGVICKVIGRSEKAVWLEPVDPDLEHLWSGIKEENAEPMNAMEVIAEFAR